MAKHKNVKLVIIIAEVLNAEPWVLNRKQQSVLGLEDIMEIQRCYYHSYLSKPMVN